MARHQPCVKVVFAADAYADEHGRHLAAIKLFDGFGARSGRKCEDAEDYC
jgi:hypothetical protein